MNTRNIAGWVLAAALVGVSIPASATMFTWSQSAGSNANADSTVNLPEGQAPSTVNNAVRAAMAAIAKYRDDLSGKLNTAGSSTVYTLTSNQTFTSLSDGIQIAFRLDETNGASPTLNVDSLGAKDVRIVSATDLAGGEMISGAIYTATFDTGGDEWLINGPSATRQIPAGTVTAYAGASLPSGWLWCDGTTGKDSTVDTSLADLFTAIGTTYGGAGAADFDLPDCKGRVIAGLEASPTRLTTAEIGFDGDTLGNAGGTQAHGLSEAETGLHDHGHTLSAPAHTHAGGFNDQGNSNVGTTGTQVNVQLDSGTEATGGASATAITTGGISNAGSGSTHTNVQPTIIMNWIIKK